ncbi:TetR family transcriptional regulator C-terminal domain-containing protein [Vibrio sp. Y2-5]|uniref:TetR/AcrR family transcriptional regulator n=1 Tax=Vibrio TaxID=662 RepID=UPI00142D9938|nr:MULTISPECIES: TetR/AcrR family transcriptional regulator [Vibrio]MBD0786629.1 TetR family transcriptional regulator C-terminal domain-containing protein [Vibrio sp. Y2-5]NIY94326.1 TetR family transcriptional regulator [Vibrio diazotrophicus]
MDTELAQHKRTISGEIRRRNETLILQAAADEFVKHGYKGTSVQAIADRVNLPKANILYYFKSKTGLYKALLKDILDLWNEGFSEDAANMPPETVLRNYIVGKMRYSRTHPQESKIFAQEIIQGAPNIRDEIQFPVVEWATGKSSVIQTWVDKGLILPVEPLYLLFLIWSSTQFYADFDTEIELIKGAPMSESEFEDAQNFLVNIIIRGLAVETS